MTVTRSWQFLISVTSGAALLLSVATFVFAGLNWSWLSLLAGFAYILAYGLAVFGLAFLATGAVASDRPHRWIVPIIAGVMMVAFAHFASIVLARNIRNREIQSALDAGLESDCRAIFAACRKDPR